MKVYMTWVTHPSAWDLGNHMTNAQHSWHLYHGLRKRYDDVEFLPWDYIPDNLAEGALLFTLSSWPIGTGGVALPRQVRERGGEVRLITNCPLYDYVVRHGMYDRNGYRGFDNEGVNYDPQLPSGYAAQQLLEVMNADVTFCHASQVGLDLWSGKRSGGEKRRDFVKGHRFVPFISPIDKLAFKREVFAPNRKKFLITNGVSHRKQQQQFRHLCGGKFVEFATTNWSWRRPGSYEHVLNKCSFVAHPSLQEAWPYFATEAMAKGLLLLGGEDWYDGYGYEELIWRQSANGSTNRANQDKVDFLVSDSPRVKQIYDDVQTRFREDPTNEWDWVLDNVFCQPKENLPLA